MASTIPTTTVASVTIYAAGPVPGGIQSREDAYERREIPVFQGSALVRVGYTAARRIADAWRVASLHLDRLPALANAAEYAPDMVGLVATLPPALVLSSAFVPVTPNGRPMPHLRIQTGPLVWLVLDRAAYRAIGDRWCLAESVLRPSRGRH